MCFPAPVSPSVGQSAALVCKTSHQKKLCIRSSLLLILFFSFANTSTQPERTPLTDHLNLLLSKLPINTAEQTFLHGTRGTRVCPVAGTIWDYRRLLVRLLVALLVAWGTTCCRGSGQPEAEAVWRLHKGAMPGLGSKQTQHVQGHTAHALLTNTE